MRTWAEINLNAITYNLKQFKNKLKNGTKLLAVVKADAYGHGSKEVSLTAIKAGADQLGVATIDEAVYLRKNSIDIPILILGSVFEEDIEDLVKYDITATIISYSIACMISNEAVKQNKTAKIHIKLDTGMSRIGYIYDSDFVTDIKKIADLPNIYIEGAFSHFSKADEEDITYTDVQFNRFIKMCKKIEDAGINIPVKHICNSAGILRDEKYHLDMVRLGISLYGHYPSDMFDNEKVELIPAMTLKSKIVNIKDLPKDVYVGYGGTYVTNIATKIATVAIGYADGYPRCLSNKGLVIINDRLCSVVGNICMDQLMVNANNVDDIKFGDEVILLGNSGNNTITVEEVATLANTVSYELLCQVGKRVPRIYIQ